MGNSESTPRSPEVISTSHHRNRKEQQTREPRDRHASATRRAAPPIATLVPSTTSNPTTSAVTTAAATSSHSRARSVTSSVHTTSRREGSTSSRQSSTMGNAESKHRPPSRSHTLPPPPSETQSPSPNSQPVDVPPPSTYQDSPNGQDVYEDNVMNSPMFGGPASNFSRPPRLPLPIDRDPEPISPLATPTDGTTPMETPDEVSLTHRPASMLSSTTLDDDEGIADIETFTLESDPSNQKILTTLEWRGIGKTVYVTGTFANWEKKFKMQKIQEGNGDALFTLTAPLPTGTHHIKFLVDGEMVLSAQYPTTVDYTASLVNYVEITARPPALGTQAAAPAEPMPIPGAVVSDAADEQIAAKDMLTEEQAVNNDSLSSTLHSTVPTAAPTQPTQSAVIPVQQPHQQQLLEHQHQQHPKPAPKKQLPRPKYTSDIPEYLVHIDLYNTPEDDRFRRASKATSHLPQPPSLPMFMSKSILNAATPHKDDASVLTMPNHTVLNHLATSSIRQGVLATSGTTRYKRKFLTTIMYKPTSDAG